MNWWDKIRPARVRRDDIPLTFEARAQELDLGIYLDLGIPDDLQHTLELSCSTWVEQIRTRRFCISAVLINSERGSVQLTLEDINSGSSTSLILATQDIEDARQIAAMVRLNPGRAALYSLHTGPSLTIAVTSDNWTYYLTGAPALHVC